MNENQIQKLYKLRYPESLTRKKKKIWEIIIYNFHQKFISENETVMEIAVGHGEFINTISSAKKIAVDINPDCENYLKKNIEFVCCDANNIPKKFFNKIDTLYVSNFLEHLNNKNELEKFFSIVKKLLKRDGKFMILGPNLRYLPGKYWDYYDHYLGLTHFSLIEALQLSGFDITYVKDKFLPHLDRDATKISHPFFVYLYLKFPIFWKVLGKQFFIIAKKI